MRETAEESVLANPMYFHSFHHWLKRIIIISLCILYGLDIYNGKSSETILIWKNLKNSKKN